MAIFTNLIIARESKISEKKVKPFEQKILKALSNCTTIQRNDDLYCNISIDGNLPKNAEKQFAKVNGNIFIGFSENASVAPNQRQSFILECMSIRDAYASLATRIIILISANPIDNRPHTHNPDTLNNDENVEVSSPMFEASNPKYSLEKVILDERTMTQLKRSIALINNQKLIFDIWGFREVDPNTKTILCFFGAPGTGKTMCAHAIAKELNKKIMIASYATIESKWVGEGPKNLRKIFKDATEQDAILFFDEADSFLSKRVNNAETGSDKHYNRMSNEMFQLLEDFGGIIIFATNLVSDFDKAFKSRILSFVEFTLPDEPTRMRLIQSMLPSKLPLIRELGKADYLALARASDGFSGREIRKAILNSLSEAALNSKNELSLDDLMVGFTIVQTERKSIEKTASIQRNVLNDFIEATAINNNIIEVCQWSINQFNEITESTKKTFFDVCNLLHLEMPDLMVSFKQKDITDACNSIIEANREKETLRYVVYLIGNLGITSHESMGIIEELCRKLQQPDADLFKTYLNDFKLIIS